MIDETLTALTDIKMPHYAPLAQASGSIDLNGTILPEYCCNTVVLVPINKRFTPRIRVQMVTIF